MSEIKGNKKIVGKINAKTLRATTTVPDWLQPLIKENGVYVGTEEPTDPEKLVWINPDGEASDLDLSNYYTKDETDSLIDTSIQNIDLSSYATKVELENYDTSEQVDAKINAIQIPEIDLSGYAKKSDIPDVSRFITEIPSEYVTETELNAKGYLTEHQSLEGYAKITDIPDVSGFALKTEIPSIEGLATETYVQEKIAAIPEVDLSGYALKSEIPTVPTKTSDLTNDSGFITSADVPEVDLSNYALKTEIPDVSAYQTQAQVIALIKEYGGGGGSLPASEEVGF